MPSPERLAATLRLLSAGSWRQAEIAARTAHDADPHDPHATLLLGLAVAAMGEAARAAPILLRAATPGVDHPCVELTRLRPALPQTLITRQFRACLALAPADHRLRLAYGGYLLDIDQPADAEAILAQGPISAAACHLMGLAQAELARFADAIASFRQATDLEPQAAASWSNLGMMLKILGRFAEAVAAHDRAIAVQPANHRLRVNRAVALLKMGDWTPAWIDYESRLHLTQSLMLDPRRLLPSLRPDETLTGRTVIALHEDGFGDTLQFLRYLPLLAERGATVIACVPPPLRRVLRDIPGVSAVMTDAQQLPAHDFICPMFSLPRVFGTTIETIPPVPAYCPNAERAGEWSAKIPAGRPRVGLVWAGQARPTQPGFGTLDRRRSAGLAAFAPVLAIPDVTFVSLQAGPAARQIRSAPVEVVDLMPAVTDFADTAAIIAGLDVVITVDTSVVHLAGLVGKPVWLLDRFDGCWRWLSGRRDSPWYPHLTLFPQITPDDWSVPMADVAAALRTLAAGRKPATEREPALIA